MVRWRDFCAPKVPTPLEILMREHKVLAQFFLHGSQGCGTRRMMEYLLGTFQKMASFC